MTGKQLQHFDYWFIEHSAVKSSYLLNEILLDINFNLCTYQKMHD